MAQFNKHSRALHGKGSLASPFNFVRQAACTMALAALLWSTQTAAQGVPPSCPGNLATADIIEHDFTVSFCELCDIGTYEIATQ